MKNVFLFIILFQTISYSQNQPEFNLESKCKSNLDSIKAYPISLDDIGIKFELPNEVRMSNTQYYNRRQITFGIYGIDSYSMPFITSSLSFLKLDEKTLNDFYEMEKKFVEEIDEKSLSGKGKINSNNFRYIESSSLNDYDVEVYSLSLFFENKEKNKFLIAKIGAMKNNNFEKSICELLYLIKTLKFIK